MGEKIGKISQALRSGISLHAESRDEALSLHIDRMEELDNRLLFGKRLLKGESEDIRIGLEMLGYNRGEQIRQMTGGLKRNRDLVIFGKTYHLPPLKSN